MIESTAPSDQIWSFSQPSARRSLILCMVGAVIGLAIAGLGLFTAQGTRTSAVPAEDVALVNQVPILMSDYVQQVRTLYGVRFGDATQAQKRKALDDMIREELYVQRGVELGLQADTIEVRTALVGAVEALSAADATMAQPSEAELHAYYDKHQASLASEGLMELADHVLARNTSPTAISAARKALQAAGPNGAVTVPPSGGTGQGEEFYFAARIHLGDRLFAVARTLKAGEVSAPVPLPDGIHLIVMRENIVPAVPPFAEVRDKVLSAYVAAQANQLTAANERFLHKRADIQVAKGFE